MENNKSIKEDIDLKSIKSCKRVNVVFQIAIIFLAIVVVFVIIGLNTDSGNVYELLSCCVDAYTIIIMTIITVTGIIVTGQGKSFLEAFSVGRKDYSKVELANIKEAVSTCQKLVAYSASLLMILCFIYVCGCMHYFSAEVLRANMAVISIAPLYAVMLELLLLPLKANVVRALNETQTGD